jgi:bifunctional non-homologous end joining protein LigD
LLVRTELETFGMPTVPMATGSKGYHLVGAIDPTVDLETISMAMQQLAAIVVHRHPDTLTTVFRVAKRGRRVYLDWLRNAHAATVVAPYSLRARPNASIAVPIEWSELETTAPDAFHLGNIQQRLDHEDSLAVLAERPVDAAPFVAAVEATFDEAGLVLETFDRFRS